MSDQIFTLVLSEKEAGLIESHCREKIREYKEYILDDRANNRSGLMPNIHLELLEAYGSIFEKLMGYEAE